MQAWQSVKVTNQSSAYFDTAGCVVRVEKNGDKERVFVRLDADDSVEPFDPSELRVL